MRESDFIHHVASSHRGSLLGGPFQFSNRGNISKYKSAFADAVKNFGQNGITDFSSVNSDWLKTNIVNFDASNCGRYNVSHLGVKRGSKLIATNTFSSRGKGGNSEKKCAGYIFR